MSGQESPSSSHSAQNISAQNPPALEIDGVSKFYGHYPALKQIKLNIERGSTVALLGRNGAGKTTLLRILAGLSRASEGSVRIFGADVRKTETRHKIGVLGHGISLYDELTEIGRAHV